MITTMKIFNLFFGVLPLITSIIAQSSTTTSQTSSIPPQGVITTTITSLITPTNSGASPTPTTLILTLTLNTTALTNSNSNSTSNANSTVTSSNSTLKNTILPWNGTDLVLPFTPALDPAYGILGGVLILSGIPVAALGGKNRWSSLAIASGYTLSVFTLVLILRFGVEPAIQPPSPSPPTQTLRGLYLLASLISSIIGAGVGIFFFTFTKYWINAAGGFSFAWFLLALRSGGLVGGSVLGRWGLLGGTSVFVFIVGLWDPIHEHVILVSTAFMGASALTLGVDCYTRAGLKEFYIYNLGYYDLFPSLNGYSYPLTQTMQVELGVMAAVSLVGAAIQFKILGMLQKRLKQIKDEEEARTEAEEVARAAERFKNLGSELSEWEEKHGEGSPSLPKTPGSGLGSRRDIDVDTLLPLDFDRQRNSSTHSLLNSGRPQSSDYPGKASSTFSGNVLQAAADTYGLLPLDSPIDSTSPSERNESNGLPQLDIPSMAGLNSPNQKSGVSSDPELEASMKLLAEVQRARQEVKGSLDILRGVTARSVTSSPIVTLSRHRPSLSASESHHRLSTTSSRILDGFELSSSTPVARPASATGRTNEWDSYIAERRVITPTAPSPAIPTSAGLVGNQRQKLSQHAIVSDHVLKARERRERTTSLMEPMVASIADFGPAIHSLGGRDGDGRRMDHSQSMNATRSSTYGNLIATQSHHLPRSQSPYESHTRPTNVTRSMTFDELAEKHRRRLSQFQEPASKRLKEGDELRKAQAEAQNRRENDTVKRERLERGVEVLLESPQKGSVGRDERRRSTDEWRRSVVGTAGSVFDSGMEGGREKRGSVGAKRMSSFAS